MISLARAVLVAAVLLLAYLDEERWVALAAGALLALEVVAARRPIARGQRRRWLERGIEFSVLASLPVALYFTRPGLLRAAPATYWLLVAGIAAPVALAFIKYGAIALHPTTLARAARQAALAAVVGFVLFGHVWPLRLLVGLLLAAAAEQVALTLLRPRLSIDRTSLAAAVRRHRESITSGGRPAGPG
jgi:hypothetical protein